MQSFHQWIKENRTADEWKEADRAIHEEAEKIWRELGMRMKRVDTSAFRSGSKHYPALRFALDAPKEQVVEHMKKHRDFRYEERNERFWSTVHPTIMVMIFEGSDGTARVTMLNRDAVE